MKKGAKEILQKGINEIIPYENNPRLNERAIDLVANSIREFGFQQPIIIDEHNVIICGHTRHKAAQKLGLKVVPCIVAKGLTDSQIRAYRIADNKVAEAAEWDEDLLDNEFELLDGIDMSQFGFEEIKEDGIIDNLDDLAFNKGESDELQLTLTFNSDEKEYIESFLSTKKKSDLKELLLNILKQGGSTGD